MQKGLKRFIHIYSQGKERISTTLLLENFIE